MLNRFYRPNDAEFWGECYLSPERFEHGEDVRIAYFPKDPPDGDGQPVEVYEVRFPARFYTIKAHQSHNSVGEPKPAFSVGTGSGMHQLAKDMAVAISHGMLGMEVEHG